MSLLDHIKRQGMEVVTEDNLQLIVSGKGDNAVKFTIWIDKYPSRVPKPKHGPRFKVFDISKSLITISVEPKLMDIVMGPEPSNKAKQFHMREYNSDIKPFLMHKAIHEALVNINYVRNCVLMPDHLVVKVCGMGCGGEDSATAERRCVLVLEGGVLFTAHNRTACLSDIVKASDTNDSIELGQLLHNLLAVSLNKTACGDNVLALAPLLKLSRVENVVYSLLLCALDESAGVDNYNFSLFRLKDGLKAILI